MPPGHVRTDVSCVRVRQEPYSEQTVEIALGTKGAFENGNISTLTRRVAADRVVSAVPPPRGEPKPPKGARDAPGGRTPPQGHRVTGPPRVGRGLQPGRHRPPRGDHP